jgi:glycosyltransferase involved in cell wall biosynthesis
MRLLLFNLATDVDDPMLGFATGWISALAERVEFIHVITMRVGHLEVPDNVRVYSIGKEKGYRESRRAVEFYRHLLRILREDNIDACFSHMTPLFTVLAAPVLRAKRIPIVTWFAHPSVTKTLKFAHHLSDRMVTGIAASYRYKRDKLTVIGHGIDTDVFSPDSKLSPRRTATILCFGRLSPVKDHPTLLKAAWRLLQSWGKPFRVVIIGGPGVPRDESYVRSLHEKVKELRLEDTVHFEPPVPKESLPFWYRSCIVYVNLTPAGFVDKVALQAMSCGKPTVVANEGFRGTLGKYSSRLLFRHGDADDLANKLVRLLSLSDRDRDQIGLYLRDQVIRMHSLGGLADKLVGIFNEVREPPQVLRASSRHSGTRRVF